MNLFHVTDSPEEVSELISKSWREYQLEQRR
jgi:hypothetical protein